MNKKEALAKKVGIHLKKIRQNKDLTLGELGLRGDVDKYELSKIENGKKVINLYTLLKICEALEITMEDFFKGFDTKQR